MSDKVNAVVIHEHDYPPDPDLNVEAVFDRIQSRRRLFEDGSDEFTYFLVNSVDRSIFVELDFNGFSQCLKHLFEQ